MHELSITQSLLSKVIDYAKENSLKEINTIHIKLGPLSGFVDDSIDFYWKEISKDTLAKDAKIVINRPSGKMKCFDCVSVFEVDSLVKKCINCKSKKLLILGGNELLLESIEGSCE